MGDKPPDAAPAPDAAPPPDAPPAPNAAPAPAEEIAVGTIAAATPVDPSSSLRKNQKRIVSDLAPLPKAGFELAWRVLWILAIVTVLLLAYIAAGEFWTYPHYFDNAYHALAIIAATPPTPDHAEAVANYERIVTASKTAVETVGARQKESREFALQVAQLILLNLFLPVLTALLGYIFGTTRDKDQVSTDKKES